MKMAFGSSIFSHKHLSLLTLELCPLFLLYFFLGFQYIMGNCFRKPAKCAHVSSNTFSEGAAKSYIQTKQDSHSANQQRSLESQKQSPLTLEVDVSASNNLKSFSLSDLKHAARNFRSESLIGEGGFGFVFKGWIDENTYAPTKPGCGMVVAIKKLKRESFQGHKEWLAEVNYLGQLHHKNLVKLVGYCLESDNRLLVYEFMQKGSLENHLFKKGVQPIPWATRMNIAIDVARGLSFLHSLDENIIYRDLKASNILLDSEFNAKLSDFGLARYGPTGDNTHVSTRVIGTQGYAAPEYVATGHLAPKSDVYSFGVVLVELLSGKQAMEYESPSNADETLAEWAKPYLSDGRRLLRFMDSRLGGQYAKKAAQAAASLALQCLHIDPKCRPPMVEVLATLEQLCALSMTPHHYHSETDKHGFTQSKLPRKATAKPN